ncbi:MAG: hypothetical protein AMXMBFR34_01040 [Myxococcaceae bacterium]
MGSGCFSLELPDPPVLGPGTVRATLLTAVPGRADLVPAQGATVRLAGTTLSATADSDGNVLLQGVMTSTGQLRFSHDSDGDGVVDRARLISLAAVSAGFGKDVNLGQLVLGRLTTLAGKALRGDREVLPSGHGGISVFLPEGPQLTFTGDDGTFRLAGVPEGEVILTAFATGYRSEASSLTTSAGEELRVATLVLQADPGGATVGQLSGVVTQSDGTPLAAVTVRAAAQGQESLASTTAEGRFTFPTLPTGVYSLALEKSGFTSLRVDGVLVQAGLNEVGPYVLTAGTSAPIPLDGGPVGPGDAGTMGMDGGAGDGGAGDAGPGDAGAGDAGAGDAGTGDAGAGDAGVDAGLPDAGLPPVAIAGPNQLILPGRPVTLNGLASTGDFPLTYAWTQLTGAPVTLSTNGTPMSHSPGFTTPAAGNVLEFSLVVTDRYGRVSAPAHTEVAAGRPPNAAFTPDGGLFYGGQTIVLSSTSTDVDNLAIASHEWTVAAGSGGAVIADGGPQALFVLPNVAYQAPDVLAAAELRVTNAVGAVSTPFQRVYTVRGASPDNWALDAGPTVTIAVGPTPVAQSLSVTLSTVIPSPPTPTYQWTCDQGISLVGATTPTPSFLPPVVQGPSRNVLCQVQATGAAPLQPMVVSTSKNLILRDAAPPTLTQAASSPRMGPFGFLAQLSEPVAQQAGSLYGNCVVGSVGMFPRVIGRWILATPNSQLTEGSSCGPFWMSPDDLAVPANTASNVYLHPGTSTLQTRWEGPFESTQAFVDPRPVVATLGPIPKYQQERFGAPMPFPAAFEILATQGSDLHRMTVDPFAPSNCNPTCPVMSNPVTFAGLATSSSPVGGERAVYSGAELLVSVQDSTDGGVAPTMVRRSPGGNWSRFDGATGAPYLQGVTGLRTARVVGGQVLVDTHDPQLDLFTTTDLVATGVTDAVAVTGTTNFVAAIRGASRLLMGWKKGTSTWTTHSYGTSSTNVLSVKAVSFDTGSVLGVAHRSTTPVLVLAPLDYSTSARTILSSGTVQGFDAAERGAIFYAVTSENGDIRLRWTSTAILTLAGGLVDFPGPPRSGFMPPYPLALDGDPICEAAWPRLAFIDEALVITWQERCAPATQWKVMTRSVH